MSTQRVGICSDPWDPHSTRSTTQIPVQWQPPESQPPLQKLCYGRLHRRLLRRHRPNRLRGPYQRQWILPPVAGIRGQCLYAHHLAPNPPSSIAAIQTNARTTWRLPQNDQGMMLSECQGRACLVRIGACSIAAPCKTPILVARRRLLAVHHCGGWWGSDRQCAPTSITAPCRVGSDMTFPK